MYDYLLSTLPANNQAIPIIDSFRREAARRETAADEKNRSITFIDQPIENLSDLCKIPDLSGKYLFVDLWATWCLPCKMEFKHNKELHTMLSKYSNIEAVYVSIDDAKSEKLWKSSIEQYPLNGYHMQAPPKIEKPFNFKRSNGFSILIFKRK